MRRTHYLLALAAVLAATTAPAESGPEDRFRPSSGEFSVMSFNVLRFGYEDRDKDGQDDDFKPPQELDALFAIVRRVRPDVLAIQEMGDPPAFDIFRKMLKERGLDYPHGDYVKAVTTNANVCVLSRFPIEASNPITNEVYSIGTNEVPVQRGFACVDIRVSEAYRFRLIVAHLKSKLFNPLGQTEMRRNEARLLNKRVRQMLRDDPKMNLIVVGDLNDTVHSAAIREALGDPPCLIDLRPRDYLGDVWTHFWSREDTYERIDYLLVSEGMEPEVVRTKTHVVRDEMTSSASDHRPLVAVFSATER